MEEKVLKDKDFERLLCPHNKSRWTRREQYLNDVKTFEQYLNDVNTHTIADRHTE